MTNLTELEPTADREARHAHRELVERLEAEKKELALQVLASQGQAAEAYQAQLLAEARLADTEAKLAKAVTCLQHIAANKITDELTVIEWDTHDTFTVLDTCISKARTLLRNEGGSDE